MSDEESFVILGSTPTPSMEAYSSVDAQPPHCPSIKQQTMEKKPVDEMIQSSLQTNFSLCNPEPNVSLTIEKHSSGKLIPMNDSVCDSLLSARETHFSVPVGPINVIKDLAKDSTTDNVIKDLAKDSTTNNLPNSKLDLTSEGISSGMIRSMTSAESSLPESVAEKYILGKIDEHTIKQSIYSQFPSFCTSEYNQKDIDKLQQLVDDNHIFKNQLWNMNSTMKQLIDMIKTNKCIQLTHQNEIAKLRNENLELKKELEARMDAIKINEEVIKTDNLSMRQALSEKSSLINNLTAQIERLELQQQDMSFEMITGIMNHENSQIKPQSVLIAEHTQTIKVMEEKLTQVIAENLELKDMKTVYIDEINCLKANLIAAEELLILNQSDITFLKSKDIEKSEILAKYNEEKDAMNQEIGLLKAQVEIYRYDFEIERNARQELAGKKEQILTDLKLLQRRNQQLIEESQQRAHNTMSPPSSSPRSTTETVYESNNFLCPLCNKPFPSLGPLEVHVQVCLSDAENR